MLDESITRRISEITYRLQLSDDTSVDLHRNLGQKRRFLVSGSDPSATAWFFENVTVRLPRRGSFPGCNSRVNPTRKSTKGLYAPLF